MTVERTAAVQLTRRHGAWLVSAYLTRLSEDCVPDDLYDCASSLPTAKRLARQMAQDLGFERGFRWVHQDPEHHLSADTWTLEAVLPPEQRSSYGTWNPDLGAWV